MRYRNVLLFCIGMLLSAVNMTAQEKAKMELTGMDQNASTVSVTVSSSNDFIMGNNKYVLHIGDAQFDRYAQGQDENNRILIFTVPVQEFNKLTDGAKTYLVYGEVEESKIEALCKDSYFPCWSLGAFDKKSLKK